MAFYGDQILSRACHEDVIVLWRIEGFCSSNPPPSSSVAPTPQNVALNNHEEIGRLTRSAFVPTLTLQSPAQYTRIIEFHTPGCGSLFFMRFKLHHVPNDNPVLAFCNAAGKIFFWDLQRLVIYREVMAEFNDPARDKTKPIVLPNWLKPITPRARSDALGRKRTLISDKDSVQSAQTGGSGDSAKGSKANEVSQFSPETLETWAAKYSLDDPHKPLKAHRTESCNQQSEDQSVSFVGRQAAWSPNGEWCVVVGSLNVTLILQRWAKKQTNGNSKPDIGMA